MSPVASPQPEPIAERLRSVRDRIADYEQLRSRGQRPTWKPVYPSALITAAADELDRLAALCTPQPAPSAELDRGLAGHAGDGLDEFRKPWRAGAPSPDPARRQAIAEIIDGVAGGIAPSHADSVEAADEIIALFGRATEADRP